MSPHRKITFQRWQVTLFLLAIAISYGWVAVGQKHLSDNRARDRRTADRALCVYVRDHVVIPDRQTILEGPVKSIPTLQALGFDEAKIGRYLSTQYGGVPVPLLVKAGFTKKQARRFSAGRIDGVAEQLALRPVPDCSQPLDLDVKARQQRG